MNIPAALIAAFPPSPDLLLDRVRRHVDDAMLLWIAGTDYGHMADEMLAELRPIRDKGIMPAPMHWQVSEVLQLTRWYDPDAPNPSPFEPGPTGRHGHQARLFACATLLRAEAEPASRYEDNTDDSTLAQCLTSTYVLGEEMSEAAARFLTWRIPRMEAHSEPVLLALGLLILATRLRSGRILDRVLGNVAEWVLAEESLYRKAFPSNPSNPMPLAFSLQYGCWQPLAAELRDEAVTIDVDDVCTNLQLCALLLEPGKGE
jgi:hypothetical protein